MKFVDLHTHSSLSSGENTPQEMLRRAEELGIGIGLCDEKRLECPSGVEIRAVRAGDFVKAHKAAREMDYVLVHGGDYRVNRLAVSHENVDILAHPDMGRKDSGIDAVLARKAEENSVAIEVNLSAIIKSRGSLRAHLLKNVKRNLMLSRKYDFDLIVTSGAKSVFELRGASGVFEFLRLIGFADSEARRAMEEVPSRILSGRLG